MNAYLATLVAEERARDRRNEAAIRRLLAGRDDTKRDGGAASDILLTLSRQLVVVSNRLRSAGEQQYTVQACCIA